MTSIEIATTVVGPEKIFCPDCKRMIFELNENGSFNLAPKAGVNMKGQLTLQETIELFAEGHCLYLRCRLRQWMRSKRNG